MPLVTVRIREGSLSAAQKESLIQRITDVIVEVEGVPEARNLTWVIIDEMGDGNLGIGGRVVDDAMIANALRAAAGRAPGGE